MTNFYQTLRWVMSKPQKFAPFGVEWLRSNSSHLFGNLEYPVLIQTLSYMRKITYYLLLIGFSHKIISMQMLGISCIPAVHEAHQLPSIYMNQWVISPANDNSAELNRQFRFRIDLNKILPDLLKLRMKVEKSERQFSQHTHRK